MAQGFTNFLEYTLGGQPGDWTYAGFFGSSSYAIIEEDADGVEGRRLKIPNIEDTGLVRWHGAFWNDAVADLAAAPNEPVEVLAKLVFPAGFDFYHIYSGIWLDNDSTPGSVFGMIGGAFKPDPSDGIGITGPGITDTFEASGIDFTQPFWLLMRHDGATTMDLWYWQDGDTPKTSADTPDITTTVPSDPILRVGMFFDSTNDDHDLNLLYFAYGTDSDPAPMPVDEDGDPDPITINFEDYYDGTESPGYYGTKTLDIPAGLLIVLTPNETTNTALTEETVPVSVSGSTLGSFTKVLETTVDSTGVSASIWAKWVPSPLTGEVLTTQYESDPVVCTGRSYVISLAGTEDGSSDVMDCFGATATVEPNSTPSVCDITLTGVLARSITVSAFADWPNFESRTTLPNTTRIGPEQNNNNTTNMAYRTDPLSSGGSVTTGTSAPGSNTLWAAAAVEVLALSAGVDVSPPVAVTVVTAHNPSVGAGAEIQPPLAVTIVSAPSPAVAAGASVSPPLAVTLVSAPDPTLGAGVLVQPPLAVTVATAPDPTIIAGASASPPLAVTLMAAANPIVVAGVNVAVPPAVTVVSAPNPAVGVSAEVEPPLAVTTVAAHNPVVTTGANVSPPLAVTFLTAPNPIVVAGASVTVPAAQTVVLAHNPLVYIGGLYNLPITMDLTLYLTSMGLSLRAGTLTVSDIRAPRIEMGLE